MSRKRSGPTPRQVQLAVWIAVGMACAYGFWQALEQVWVADDAFISFRYAWHLVEGNGLVYNVGETVEGYTNFLWTILVAGGMALNLEPIGLTRIMSLASYLVTAGALVVISRRIWTEGNTSAGIVIPLAAIAILLQRDSHVWATSGMETAMTTALVTVGFALLVLGSSPRTFLLGGLTLIAAALTRPDAMIFYMMGIPFLLTAEKRRWRAAIMYLLPLLLIYLPYWLWRYNYYGYPFPNTYYAKSAYDSYWSQGLFYLWLYFKTYYVLLMSGIGIVFLFLRAVREWMIRKALPTASLRIGLLACLFAVPYLVYVARVGGDFMFARFLVPITPILFLILETSLVRLARSLKVALPIAAIFLVAVVLRWNQFSEPLQFIDGIVDEKTFYPVEEAAKAERDGKKLRKYFDEIDVPVGILGSRAMLAYYAQFSMAIECSAGLTDEYLAHIELTERGRPGHEKEADYEYLKKRGVRFMFFYTVPEYGRYGPIRKISFNGVEAGINSYDPALMNQLKKFPEVKFADFLQVLDNYIVTMENLPIPIRQADFNFFRQYYFEHVNDDERLRQLVAKLNMPVPAPTEQN